MFAHTPSRRRLGLATLVLTLLIAVGSLASGWFATAARAASNPIVAENQLPGTTGWQIGLAADDTHGQIKGYASATSVLQGQPLKLYVSVNPAQTYTVDVYRIGWYGGNGGRLLQHIGPLSGSHQSACTAAPTTGLIACSWSLGTTITPTTSWTSGAYVALLTNAAGYQNYIVFVVRDGRPAQFLFQAGVNTYEAYNNYPDNNTTGKSLYDYNSWGAKTAGGTTAAVKVSFDRPYSDDGSGLFFAWEFHFILWAEQMGYDITYSTDVDTQTNGAALLNSKAFLSVGHDEYWSQGMYNAAQTARDSGVSLAFFGSNDVYWQVRFENSASGVANRVLVCYKLASADPVQGPTTTVEWRDPLPNRPEQGLMGIMFDSYVSWGVSFSYDIVNSSNWTYSGTGVKDGDSVPSTVGYEMDREFTEYPLPANTSYTLLSHSPYTDVNNASTYANSSIYQAPSGAWVFAAGTEDWATKLDATYVQSANNTTPDPRIQQMTATILNKFIGATPPTPTPSPTGTPTGTPTATPTPLPTGGIATVQVGRSTEQYSATLPLSLLTASTKGTMLVAALDSNSGPSFAAPTGWVRASSAITGTTSEVWYYPNNPGGIVSASFTSTSASATAGIMGEYSGAAASPLDSAGTATTNAATTTVSVSTAAAVGAGDLAITSFAPFLNGGGTLTVTPGPGWSGLGSGGGADWFHFAFDSRASVAAGSLSETETSSAGAYWSGAIAAFKPAVVPTPTPTATPTPTPTPT
ncbi:MAG: hypothetical protein JOZ75_13110, partial [Candidatus Dormibacteraeota bacterium]|nr:hypothetical protein [Candidatus Dormibacteraeota bacterium]